MNNTIRFNPSTTLVPEVRYDLGSDIALLDGESQLGLLDLAFKWSEQNSALVAEAAEPFPLVRTRKDDIDLGLLIRGGKSMEERYEEARAALADTVAA